MPLVSCQRTRSYRKRASSAAKIGVTNMARPNRGLIGIRLDSSNEFGPTGEEDHGTNMSGIVVSDLDALMNGLKDGDIVYIRETARPESAPKPKKARTKPAAGNEKPKKKPAAKKKVKKNAAEQ